MNDLKETIVMLSEKNTELISELEISQSQKCRRNNLSFHSDDSPPHIRKFVQSQQF